jgi:hypothetical protein
MNTEYAIPLMLVVNPGQDIRDDLEEAIKTAFTKSISHSTYSRPFSDEHPRLIAHKKPYFEMVLIDGAGLIPLLRAQDARLVPNWLREDILKRTQGACVILLAPENQIETSKLYYVFRNTIGACELVSRNTLQKDKRAFAEQLQSIWTANSPKPPESFLDKLGQSIDPG